MYYFLKYFIYFLKKHKLFIVIYILFVLFVFFGNSVHAVTYTNPTGTDTTLYATIDTEEGFRNHYDNITNTFMAHGYYRWRNFNDPTIIQILASLENSEGGIAKFVYFYATADYIDCVVYRPIAVSSADIANWYGGRYSYISPSYELGADVSSLTVYRYALNSGYIYLIPATSVTENLYVPFPIWCQYSQVFTYWRERLVDLQDNAQYHNTLYDKLDDILVTLGQQNVNAILNNIENNTEETAKETKEIKELMKDTTVDNSLSSKLPTDNTQDSTTDGVNNIFSFLQTAFTTGTAKDLVIPVPFTGKSFVINPNFIQSILVKNDFKWVAELIEVFWWYLISKFIVGDVCDKFTKIKSGNVEDIQNNNIKEEML